MTVGLAYSENTVDFQALESILKSILIIVPQRLASPKAETNSASHTLPMEINYIAVGVIAAQRNWHATRTDETQHTQGVQVVTDFRPLPFHYHKPGCPITSPSS